MLYPVKIERDGHTWMASFPDVPEALTCGDTREEALMEAADALVTAFEFYFESERPIPLPSLIDGDSVAVPASVWVKVLLLNTMLAVGIQQAELARRLGIPRQNVQRLIDLRHATKIDALEQALAVMEKRLELQIY